MNREQVIAYLEGPGNDEVDLVIMPRRFYQLLERKQIGVSSEVMLQQLMDIDLQAGSYYPRDLSDIRRCLHLVRDFPELRDCVPRMAEVSSEWAIIVSYWDDLEEAYWNGRGHPFGGPSDISKVWDKVWAEIEAFQA